MGLMSNCSTGHQCDDRVNGDLDNLLCTATIITQIEITQFKQNSRVRYFHGHNLQINSTTKLSQTIISQIVALCI